MTPPTTNEILDELAAAFGQGAAPVDDADGVTVRELCARLGWGEERVRKLLAELKEAGRLSTVRVKRERLDGIRANVTAYRLAPEDAP